MQVGEGLTGFFKDGASVFRHEMLRQIGDDGVLGCRHRAACGGARACQDFEQCALSGAVLAHQGYAVFFVDDKGNIFEKGCAAEFDGQSIY